MYSSSPFTKSYHLVELGGLSQVQQDGVLPVYLPGDTILYEFKASHVESHANGDYIWMGELMERNPASTNPVDRCAFGSTRILKTGSMIYGEIQVDTTHFNIKPLGDSLWMLIELDNGMYSGPDCPPSDDEFAPPPPEQTAQDRSGMCPVRVAVLYTEAAEAESPDIINIINLAIASTNKAFLNSAIPKSQVHLILAGTQLLTEEQFVEGTDLRDDASDLVTNPTVVAAKAAMFADLVIVMTADVYADRGKVAQFGGLPTSASNALAIVGTPFANQPTYTFAHEVGHLFGCRHQNSGNCHMNHDDDGLEYAHGYAFNWEFTIIFTWECWFLNTIMSACYDITSREKILNYSNPDVTFKGEPTGTPENNNAKLLRESACTVAQYVGGETPIVSITGLDRMCPEAEVVLAGEIQGVPGPCTFEWYVSDDGFSWGSPVSTASVIQITMPAQIGKFVFVKLIAGNVNGPFITAFKSVLSDTTGLVCFRSVSANKPSPIFIEVVPNPGKDAVRLIWPGEHEGPVTLRIINSFGQQVGIFLVGQGETETTLNVAHLPGGMYFLHSKSTNKDGLSRFVVLR